MISRRRVAILALIAGTVAAVVTACGGGSGSGTAAPAPSATGVQAQLAAYVSCLNQNGVKITLPSGGAGGFGGGTRGSGRPTGFPTSRPTGSFSPRPRPSGSDGAGGFAGRGGGGFLGKPADVDQATWDKAVAACKSVLPSFGAGGGFGGGRGGDNGANAAYQNCLRDHGMTAGTSPSADALQACSVLKPTAAASS